MKYGLILSAIFSTVGVLLFADVACAQPVDPFTDMFRGGPITPFERIVENRDEVNQERGTPMGSRVANTATELFEGGRLLRRNDFEHVLTTKIKYDQSGNPREIVQIHSVDFDNRPEAEVREVSDVYTAEYDTQGNITSITFKIGKFPKTVALITTKAASDGGKEISYTLQRVSGPPSKDAPIVQIYDKACHLIEKQNPKSPSTERRSYNDHGDVDLITTVSGKRTISMKFEYVYDNKDNWTKRTEYVEWDSAYQTKHKLHGIRTRDITYAPADAKVLPKPVADTVPAAKSPPTTNPFGGFVGVSFRVIRHTNSTSFHTWIAKITTVEGDKISGVSYDEPDLKTPYPLEGTATADGRVDFVIMGRISQKGKKKIRGQFTLNLTALKADGTWQSIDHQTTAEISKLHLP